MPDNVGYLLKLISRKRMKAVKAMRPTTNYDEMYKPWTDRFDETGEVGEVVLYLGVSSE